MDSKTRIWAEEIVGQMATEDRLAVLKDGAEAWREGVASMTWEAREGERPSTSDVLGEIEVVVAERLLGQLRG